MSKQQKTTAKMKRTN